MDNSDTDNLMSTWLAHNKLKRKYVEDRTSLSFVHSHYEDNYYIEDNY